jgi:hypothetical protein
MSQCPSCGRELPGLQTLCAECYESRYVAIGQRRGFLQELRWFVLNPLGISEQDLTEASGLPLFFTVGCWCIGLLLCWFGGWAKVHYQYSLFSDVVLRGALVCLIISLILSLVLARKNLHFHWKLASFTFVLMSMGVAGWFYVGSNAFTALAKVVNWR